MYQLLECSIERNSCIKITALPPGPTAPEAPPPPYATAAVLHSSARASAAAYTTSTPHVNVTRTAPDL